MNGGRNHYLVFRDNVRCWCVYMGTYSSRKKSWFFQNCYFSTKQQNNWSFVDIWKRLFTHGDGVCCVCTTPASVSGSEAESSSGPVVGERGQEDTVLTRGWHWDSPDPASAFSAAAQAVTSPLSCQLPPGHIPGRGRLYHHTQSGASGGSSQWLVNRYYRPQTSWHRDIVRSNKCDRVWQSVTGESHRGWCYKMPPSGGMGGGGPDNSGYGGGAQMPANQKPVSGHVISPSQSEGECKWPSGGSFKRIIGVLRRNSGEKEKFCSFRDV